ncbi:MAG: S41 family peptidase [Paludibacteraceae bacterium]
MSWINKSDISNSLKNKLKEIYNNRVQGNQYYIALEPSIKNPDFKNENTYSNMPYPDSGFRLLSLYRYWNMINYFFPNKDLTNKDWNKVLKEYIPKFINAKNELEYELVVLQIIGEINDTHASLWNGGNKINELRGNNYAPFKVEFIENKLVVTDYYNPKLQSDAKLKIGDIITHINGRTVKYLVDSLKIYYPASNNAARLRDISDDILRSSQNSINLQYISENQNKQNKINLYSKQKLNMYWSFKVNENMKCYRMLDGNIGYLTLANIQQKDIPEIKKILKDTKGIIIDIRNYPSTFVPFALGSFFMSEPTAFVKFTHGNPDNPGEFTYTNNLLIPVDSSYYKGKLVVLVNEKSQSQAEYTAMAFRSVKNSKIIGSTTAGADGNVSIILLPGGLSSLISGIGVYYPDGRETQRVGIIPDIVVKPTIKGIKEGRDEVLEKAIELLEKQ